MALNLIVAAPGLLNPVWDEIPRRFPLRARIRTVEDQLAKTIHGALSQGVP